MKQEFPKSFSREGKMKGFKVKIEFTKDAKVTQQKGRRNPLQLQQAVEVEIEKLLEEGHIRKALKINDEVFIQPVVMSVIKEKSVKIALDARSLSDAIQKDKFQVPNLDILTEQVAEIINDESEGVVKFT